MSLTTQHRYLYRVLSGIFAAEVDPLSNLRPDGIEGLIYYLYRWTGSYYNGTTKIRLRPQNYVEHSDCDTFAPGPIVISFSNSLLAVTQTNGYLIKGNHDVANPLAFSLKFWDSGVNVLPDGNMNDGPIKEIQEISSVEMNKKDKPGDTTAAPPWHLAATHDAALTYSFTGYRNATNSPQLLRFNYTQCASPSLGLYNGMILEAHSVFSPTINITTEPRVSASFSNESASLEIKGVFQGKSDGGSFLGGNVTISFEGKIDEARSDQLVSNTHDGTPVWEATLGYKKTLTGEEPEVLQGFGRKLQVDWGWMVGVIGLVFICGL
ncbi:hypothetical protein N0V90_009202 [Kalmusia sp. IMI 367209]|nr:hypothetical protein N0V90_009202 [Kalmusia sp. IMI 367209]